MQQQIPRRPKVTAQCTTTLTVYGQHEYLLPLVLFRVHKMVGRLYLHGVL